MPPGAGMFNNPRALRHLLALLPGAMNPVRRGDPARGVFAVKFEIGAANALIRKLAVDAGLRPHPTLKEFYVDERFQA